MTLSGTHTSCLNAPARLHIGDDLDPVGSFANRDPLPFRDGTYRPDVAAAGKVYRRYRGRRRGC